MNTISNESFKKLGILILIVSTFKVLLPMKKLEYYFLRFRKYYRKNNKSEKL